MIVDLVKLAFLTLVAADLEADLSSARKAASAFEDILWDINHTSTGSDVPTSLTSDYVSFISAFSSFNGALEGVGADDFTSGSISLYNDAAAVFFYMGFVLSICLILLLFMAKELGIFSRLYRVLSRV